MESIFGNNTNEGEELPDEKKGLVKTVMNKVIVNALMVFLLPTILLLMRGSKPKPKPKYKVVKKGLFWDTTYEVYE